MNAISFRNVQIGDGFWKKKQELARKTTVYAVYERFVETGRFQAFKQNWKEGDPNKPHIFWDSDVAKWIEGAAYMMQDRRDPKLMKIIEEVIDDIEAHISPEGYYNSYFQQIETDSRFTRRECHELYCAGHLIEAAVAYYYATGTRRFLDLMCRYADYIEKRFKTDRDTAFVTPGHEEIELALVKLYECTGEKRYLELSEFFLNERGRNREAFPGSYKLSQTQSHVPVRETSSAEGHAVRAAYLYSAMADVARLTKDEALFKACQRVFDDIYYKKMYVTGGIGSTSNGEGFTVPYDLPNLLSYTETCAGIGLAFFAHRMLLLEADSRYADTVERILYNGFLSSLSLDGKAFFYENPLEVLPYMHTRDVSMERPNLPLPPYNRSQVFQCSCCPPNIVRFLPSLGNFIFTRSDDVLYVHQYVPCRTTVKVGGRDITVEIKTRMPEDGKVKISVTGGDLKLAIRIPWWAAKKFDSVRGYHTVEVKDGKSFTVNFGMKTRLVEARPEVRFDCNRFAVMRGPVVYCLESVDNGEYLRDIRLKSRFLAKKTEDRQLGVTKLIIGGFRRPAPRDGIVPLYRIKSREKLTRCKTVLIPYYAFANRGPAEMQVWTYVK